MLSFKNNNIYYYHYKILTGQLSLWLMILLFWIIWYNKDILKYISYVCIAIFVIGTINSYFEYKKYNLLGLFIFPFFVHLPFLYPLLDFKKYFKPNIIQFIFMLISLFIINFLPYWPYLILRKSTALLLVLTCLITFLFYCFYENSY